MQGNLKMNPYTAPCGDCPEKGCGPKHATCEAYIAYRKAADEYNKSKVDHAEQRHITSGMKSKMRRYDRAKREGRLHY